MECLSCGHCCGALSPFADEGGVCPHLVEAEKDIFLCGIYHSRPEACQNHRYPARFCPIGISILELRRVEDVHARINKVFELTVRSLRGVKGGNQQITVGCHPWLPPKT